MQRGSLRTVVSPWKPLPRTGGLEASSSAQPLQRLAHHRQPPGQPPEGWGQNVLLYSKHTMSGIFGPDLGSVPRAFLRGQRERVYCQATERTSFSKLLGIAVKIKYLATLIRGCQALDQACRHGDIS